ncbi:MAG: TadE/TadG family type IV pilus assembly protein [Caldilineaceae bacterium]
MKYLLRREEGTSLVELALLLPLFLLLILGVFDFGNGFNTYLGMTNAAREGAVWIARFPDDRAGMNERMEQELARVGMGLGNVTLSVVPDKLTYEAGEKVTVQITHPYPLMFGAVTKHASLTLRTKTTMKILNQ